MIITLVVIAVLGAAAYWLIRLRKARDPET
jgi:hypothetical protein